jgi:hypothetical protein
VPQANVTANTVFGIQYDLYLPQNEFAIGQGAPFEGISGVNHGIAPGGVPITDGALLSYGDGGILVYDKSQFAYLTSGYSFGEGWQTVETSYTVGPDLGGTADTTISVYLTRDDANSAGALARTLIYQTTDSMTLGDNWRADFNNSGPGRYYLDNVILGTVATVPEPGSSLLAAGALLGLMFARGRRR